VRHSETENIVSASSSSFRESSKNIGARKLLTSICGGMGMNMSRYGVLNRRSRCNMTEMTSIVCLSSDSTLFMYIIHDSSVYCCAYWKCHRNHAIKKVQKGGIRQEREV
jgi:hypothetical protein